MKQEADKFHDVADLVTHFGTSTLRDFEGFADIELVLKTCLNEDEETYVWDLVCAEGAPELHEAVRDITLNIVCEAMDQADTVPDWSEVFQIAYTAHAMLTTRSWLKTNFDPTTKRG